MDLDDLDFKKLLPAFMRKDEADIGFSDAINKIVSDIIVYLPKLETWDYIDVMTDDELDELAWELNILWYNKNASLAAKRQIIKDSDKVFSSLGTVWAVQRVIETYFGTGKVIEWFDYEEGLPGHFKVQTMNSKVTNEDAEEFLRVLNLVKRASAHLDAIEIVAHGELVFNVFIGTHDVTYETNRVIM